MLAIASVVEYSPDTDDPAKTLRKFCTEYSPPFGATKVHVRLSKIVALATNSAVSPVLRFSLVGFFVIVR